ncbi:MAG TPA: carbonic anhydrase, partial [Actinomycetota bacterium]
EGLRARVTEATGWEVEIDFLPFDDAERALLDDVRAITRDSRLAFDAVSGFLYDVCTGRLREVAPG